MYNVLSLRTYHSLHAYDGHCSLKSSHAEQMTETSSSHFIILLVAVMYQACDMLAIF